MDTNNLVKLITKYLAKQSKLLKCGHKKGDPNHLEAA
jgi:hypothetical protein